MLEQWQLYVAASVLHIFPVQTLQKSTSSLHTSWTAVSIGLLGTVATTFSVHDVSIFDTHLDC
jgi:hypothetical protein